MKPNYFSPGLCATPPKVNQKMRIPLEITIVIMITILAPITGASILPNDCNQFSDWKQEECQNILTDSSLSLEQKQDLYLNLLNSQEKLASYDFVWSWNESLQWIEPPATAPQESSGIIQNAWVKIVSVDKGYFDLEKQEWFVQPTGQILTEHDYSIEVPSGTEGDDCQTNYSLEILNNALAIELNGANIGNQRITQYFSSATNNGQMNFAITLSLQTRLIVDHYKEIETCDLDPRYWDNGCRTTCKYEFTEERFDSVNPRDEFNSKAKDQSINVETFLEENPGLNKITIKLNSDEPINEFFLEAGENFFSFSESNFDLQVTEDGILFVTKQLENSDNYKNFVKLSFVRSANTKEIVLATTSWENCSQTITTDFLETQSECNLIRLEPVQIKIVTDENSFDFKDQVELSIELLNQSLEPMPNENVVIGMGEDSINLTTDSEGMANISLPASQNKGVFLASFLGSQTHRPQTTVKRVALQDEQSFESSQLLVGFFGAYYFVFLIAKKLMAGAI